MKGIRMEEVNYNEIKEKVQFKTPNRIYIDMSLLNDFYLGTILFKSFVLDNRDQETYSIIIDNLDLYNTRYLDNVEYIFPELNYQHKDILALLHNSEYHSHIFSLSPKTNIYLRLEERLLDINNKTAIIKNQITPTLVFNTYPFELPDELQNSIKVYYSDSFQFNVEIINQYLLDIDKDFLLGHDEFYMYDFITFIKDTYYSELFTKEKLLSKTIHAPKRIENIDKIKDLKKEDIELDFIVTESYLKLAIQFYYLYDMKVLLMDEE
jgi:hypothetical protein